MKDDDLGFSFRSSGSECVILHHGRVATKLRKQKAARFEREVADMTFSEQQQLMARLTGNYKRGNERTAGNHPRNRG